MEFPNFRPRYKDFELIGDSLMLRFVFQSGLGPHGIERARRLGLCISGITVEGLINEINARGIAGSKVMVLIGTNDILQASKRIQSRDYLLSVRGFYKRLKNMLVKTCDKVYFMSVPPIPRLERRQPDYVVRLGRINRLIESWPRKDGKVIVLPLHEVMTSVGGKADCTLFERQFRASRGKAAREDGVHLNEEGNRVLLHFLDCIFNQVQTVEA